MKSRPKQITWANRIVGAILVAAAIFLNYKTMGPATNFLSGGLIVAYLVWAFGRWTYNVSALPLYLIGIGVQCLHFGEEYLTDFQQKFPALFGYNWTVQRFVVFNLVWLGVFLLAAIGMWRKVTLAYLIVLFFAIIGEVANGIAHLSLSIARRSYFPGTITAPVILIIGIMLTGKLMAKPEDTEQGADSG
jgi:Protein of unknown function with HXXEE motif